MQLSVCQVVTIQSVAHGRNPDERIIVQQRRYPPAGRQLPVTNFSQLPLSGRKTIDGSIPTCTIQHLPRLLPYTALQTDRFVNCSPHDAQRQTLCPAHRKTGNSPPTVHRKIRPQQLPSESATKIGEHHRLFTHRIAHGKKAFVFLVEQEQVLL